MKAVIRTLAFTLLMFLPNHVFACPPGSVPIHGQGRCGSPSEATAAVNAANAAGRQSAPPREVWQNKYGALAADYEAGRSGVAEDENSLRAAKRVALRQCGTRNCKITASTVNGCLAAVHGGGGSAVGGGQTREEAIQVAMNICQADGSRCELRYAYCNNPVRIR